MELGLEVFRMSTAVRLSLAQGQGEKGPEYLAWIADVVSKNKSKTSRLKNPPGAVWTVGDVDDTIYRGCPRQVNGWGKFYLPEVVTMQVVGAVQGTSYPCDELVLMTCEDEKIYAYDGEELHLVASSMEQLCAVGLEHPPSKSYYNGEAFKDMTEEDWDKVRKGAVARRSAEEHHQLVTSYKSEFLKQLTFKIPLMMMHWIQIRITLLHESNFWLSAAL